MTAVPSETVQTHDVRVNAEYELFYKIELGGTHPDEGKPFSVQRTDLERRNELFCKSMILFTNPNEAPEDEVAMVCDPSGTGIMMEWERPISMFHRYCQIYLRLNGIILIVVVVIIIVRETARLLLEGMPRSGLRILNIGFGIGMVHINFEFRHVLFLNCTV
jgi:hypothetical protein